MSVDLTKPELQLSSRSKDLPTETSGILRIFGRNTLWLWVDLGALRLGTMLAGLFLIRYFGPVQFGLYSMALAVGWVANAVIDLGLTRYSARAVAASQNEVRPILALSLLTTIVTALPAIGLLLIASPAKHLTLACLAAGFILCNLEGTSSLCSSILTADLRSREILPGSVIGALALIGLTATTIWLRLSPLALLVGLSFKSLAVLSLRLWQLRSYWPAKPDWSWSACKRVASRAWPFFANNLTQVAYGKAAILCLGYVATQAAVGWFAAAFSIADVIPQWSYAISGAILPVWTRLYETSRIQDMLSLRNRLLDVILVAVIPIWISLAAFARPLCGLLGAQYLPSAAILQIVALRSVLSVLDGFLGHGFLVAIDRVKERQQALLRCMILLIVLSLGLGRVWGAVGVGLALVISDATLILQYLWIASRIHLKLSWPAAITTLLAAGFMAICAVGLPNDINFVLRGTSAVAVYFVVLFLVSKNRVLSFGQTLWECVER